MSGLRIALIALAVAGLATRLVALAIVLGSEHDDDSTPWIVLALTLGWSFIGAGRYARWRRPENRVGPLMTMVGFFWFLGSLSSANDPWVSTSRLPPAVEAAAYFVVMEALTNVAEYASAKTADVKIEQVNGAVVVDVQDDGIGGADPAAGIGLSGLADRVAALGGRLMVESPPGGGTVVRAELPARRSGAAIRRM